MELNPHIAKATSSERKRGLHLRSRFIPHTSVDLIAFAVGKCLIPTRCRDLHLKQFCLEDIVPAVLIILITHIILAVRWMLIKILSVVINHHGRGNTVVSGGCHPNNNIIRKIDQKSKMGLSHFVTLILYSVYRHARYCGYYN